MALLEIWVKPPVQSSNYWKSKCILGSDVRTCYSPEYDFRIPATYKYSDAVLINQEIRLLRIGIRFNRH